VFHIRDVGGLSEQLRQAMPPRVDGKTVTVGFAGEASRRGVSGCSEEPDPSSRSAGGRPRTDNRKEAACLKSRKEREE